MCKRFDAWPILPVPNFLSLDQNKNKKSEFVLIPFHGSIHHRVKTSLLNYVSLIIFKLFQIILRTAVRYMVIMTLQF